MSVLNLNNGIKVEILNENLKYTTVVIQGNLNEDDIKKSANLYIDLYKKGVKRIFIDLSAAAADFKALLSSHEDLNKGLIEFEKIAVLIADSKDAFKVKAAAQKNLKIQVFYDKSDALKWLAE
jgi:hypothetical protein